MKLSDYVIDQLVQRGSTHAFGMSGGAAVHLFDSAARHPGMGVTFVANEQSASIAADAYARLSGRAGVAIVTSGPGATNLLTGTACSYFDSVPTVMLTGQVATHRQKGNRPVRQVGFQEADVVSMFGSVTKYAAQLRQPADLPRLINEAFDAAYAGRPGPVLLDLPDDLQRAEIDAAGPESRRTDIATPQPDQGRLEAEIDALFDRLAAARRPVVILGGGLTTPDVIDDARPFLERLALPILQTWAGVDVVPHDWPLRCGTFGVYGPRLGNFVIQNADVILCLGTRLSQNLTGGILDRFAPGAHIVMVDADQGEMDKFDGRGITIATRIHARLDQFFAAATARPGYAPPMLSGWVRQIEAWRTLLPDDHPPVPLDTAGHVDAINFVDVLSEVLAEDEIILVDTGGNLTWTCNTIRTKARQRLISAWNFTPMGYALPAVLGAAAACPGRPITCIIGDGGLQLCLHELSTILRYRIPVKIFLFNNHAHGIQKQTLETWLDANYVGVDEPSGLAFCNFPRVAEALGFPVVNIAHSSEIAEAVGRVCTAPGPIFCNVEINREQRLLPFLKYGGALDQQNPPLDHELLRSTVITSQE